MYKQDMRGNILYSAVGVGHFIMAIIFWPPPPPSCPTLPHLLNNKYCHNVKEEQYFNLTVYLKSYEGNYLNDDY